MAEFFALLLFGGAAGTLAVLVSPQLRRHVEPVANQIAAIVAMGATLGSLYFSEVADYIPCDLCWYQRIAMYPLAVIIPLAVQRNDFAALRYVRILATIGIVIAAYHVQLQWFPDQSSMCEVSNPCSGRWVEAFGWMTIPQMAGISFALVIAMTTFSLRSVPNEPHGAKPEGDQGINEPQ